MTHQHDHAIIMRPAVGLFAQRLNQFQVVPLIRFGFSRVTRRQDARIAIERVDANAGIIGQGWKSCIFAGMACFGKRIFHKRAMRLVSFGYLKES